MTQFTQAERDRLEGVDLHMRDAIKRAKVLQHSKAIGCCQVCSYPVRFWGGVREIEGGRTCHLCRTYLRLFIRAAGLGRSAN